MISHRADLLSKITQKWTSDIFEDERPFVYDLNKMGKKDDRVKYAAFPDTINPGVMENGTISSSDRSQHQIYYNKYYDCILLIQNRDMDLTNQFMKIVSDLLASHQLNTANLKRAIDDI